MHSHVSCSIYLPSCSSVFYRGSSMNTLVVKDLRQSRPHYPLEIYECIIGFGPVEDIINCTMVCKAWYPSSRYLSLQTVYLRSQEQTFRLASILRTNPQLGQSSRKSTLLIDPQVSVSVLSPTPVHRDVFLHLSRFTEVTTLSLEKVEIFSPSTLAALICALPAVSALKCTRVSFRSLSWGPLRRPRGTLLRLDLNTDDHAASASLESHPDADEPCGAIFSEPFGRSCKLGFPFIVGCLYSNVLAQPDHPNLGSSRCIPRRSDTARWPTSVSCTSQDTHEASHEDNN
ncbi:uncharacterized protein C8Q71DRAFT_40152 [Rhodofomes roseus]|uniref:F-box domain-containing protein n=1 Tax=Rhodofomes roseus TaxID=34475 RepID=A0ABQ8KYN5_9APHY|nr:uncharacterized protein C8Q71DRAFT_40152 [Rhodofomes roseus]KAH9844321.1 hypothetical protein C8Q71DRAFT_40152 [Rhodofomes roseus]